MRKALLLLTPLLLASCVDESASYYIDGTEHTLSVRATQQYFWDDTVQIKLVLARLPECQRQFTLAKVPLAEADIELFAAGENIFTLRAGSQVWQVETTACTQLGEPPANGYGLPVGVFHLNEEKKFVFDKVAPAS